MKKIFIVCPEYKELKNETIDVFFSKDFSCKEKDLVDFIYKKEMEYSPNGKYQVIDYLVENLFLLRVTSDNRYSVIELNINNTKDLKEKTTDYLKSFIKNLKYDSGEYNVYVPTLKTVITLQLDDFDFSKSAEYLSQDMYLWIMDYMGEVHRDDDGVEVGSVLMDPNSEKVVEDMRNDVYIEAFDTETFNLDD